MRDAELEKLKEENAVLKRAREPNVETPSDVPSQVVFSEPKRLKLVDSWRVDDLRNALLESKLFRIHQRSTCEVSDPNSRKTFFLR